jgi:serine/threonine protein phosphatase PrpC
MVDDETILRTVLESGSDLEAAGRGLIAEANRRGGEDNITVILIHAQP